MSIMDKLKSMFSGGSGEDAHADHTPAAPAETPAAGPADPLGTPMPEAGMPHAPPPSAEGGDEPR